MASNGPKFGGIQIDAVWIDELNHIKDLDMTQQKADELAKEVNSRLEALAERITEHCKDNDPKIVRLFAPLMLTVNVPVKGYRKESHIGGEEFKLLGAHLGKKGKLIFDFAPEATVSYTGMEMEADDAMAHLEHFRNHVDVAAGGDFVATVTAIRRLASDAREAAASVSKFTEYEEIGFGSW